ncbi:MAG: hypothetical protein E4H02_11145 [Lentisphaerales bacterium]|jgi:hypothetical protein|nr:MAG: hypothetical protein E4H02_11145 [Lentisphaerales bacterium]
MAVKIKIDKNMIAAKNGKSTRRPATAGKSRARTRSPDREGDSGQIVAIVAGVLVVIMILAAAISAATSSSKRKPKRYRSTNRTVANTAPRPAKKPSGPHRYKELNGMTMKEWMAQNNNNNEMLQSRQNRVNAYEKSGQNPSN